MRVDTMECFGQEQWTYKMASETHAGRCEMIEIETGERHRLTVRLPAMRPLQFGREVKRSTARVESWTQGQHGARMWARERLLRRTLQLASQPTREIELGSLAQTL